MPKLARATAEVESARPSAPKPRTRTKSQLSAKLTTIDSRLTRIGVRASLSAKKAGASTLIPA
jgi:hypothetical protein